MRRWECCYNINLAPRRKIELVQHSDLATVKITQLVIGMRDLLGLGICHLLCFGLPECISSTEEERFCSLQSIYCCSYVIY